MVVETTTKYVWLGGRQAVIVECDRCDHQAWAWGWGDNSVRRCCAILCETCPEGEDNYYDADVHTPPQEPDQLELKDVEDMEN